MKLLKHEISAEVFHETLKAYRKTAIILIFVFLLFITIGLTLIYAFCYVQDKPLYTTQASALNGEFLRGSGVRTASNLTTVFFSSEGRRLLTFAAEDYELDYEKLVRVSPFSAAGSASDPTYSLRLLDNHLQFYAVVSIKVPAGTYISSALYVYYIWRVNAVLVAWTTFLIGFTAIFILGLILVFLYHIKAAELETMRRDYVSNISHELKTPISSIKSLTEALSDGMIQDEITVSRYYGIILSEAGRLERAVLNLLELNRLQSGRVSMAKAEIPADRLFWPICERFYVRCDDIGIEFSTNISKGQYLPTLLTSEASITELTEILLDNAVKFTPDGGHISLTVSPRRHTKCIVITVADDGCGISPEELPHIFERFYKGGEEHSGSGLGLAIGQEIVKQLDERLWVKSEPGKGTQFMFTVSVAHW